MGKILVLIVLVLAAGYSWHKGWVAQWYDSLTSATEDEMARAAQARRDRRPPREDSGRESPRPDAPPR